MLYLHWRLAYVNRLWKQFITGGWLKPTSSVNRAFTLAVGLSQPPVKNVSTGGRKSLTPPDLYHRRVVTGTACGIKRGRQQ